MFVFLPGLGADHRLFKFQSVAFPGSTAIDWIEPLPNERLEDYAVRLAESFPRPEGEIIVCGLSLGGMMAPYVARHLKACGCVLLCSVRGPSEFPRRYYLGWLLCRICPPLLWAAMFIWKTTAGFFSRFVKHETIREVMLQFAGTKTARVARMTKMMLDWAYRKHDEKTDKADHPEPEIRTIHVHGTSDSLLPIGPTHPDIIIERGGHLLCLSRPEQINEILREFAE